MKNIIIFIILCLIYLLALFINQKIIWSFYLVFLILILASRQKLVYIPVRVLILLSIPLVWAALLSFNYSLYSNLQGLFYLSVPVIMVLIGYQLSKLLGFRQYLIYIVYLGTIISLVYISIVVADSGLKAFLSPYKEARFVVGSGSPASILCLIIAAYARNYGIKIFRDNIQRDIFVLINLAAIYLFASRTYWVVLIIFLIMFNLKSIKKHQVIFFIGLCALLIVILISSVRITEEITRTKSLFVKALRIFSEIRMNNFQTYSDINTHYRGYESYRALMTYLEGNPFNILFGYGLGKPVDLKASVYLAGSYRTIIPWIHNGYFFVLLKEGLIGLVALVLFFIHVLKIGYANLGKNDTEKRFMSLLTIGSVFSLILSNYVVCSMFTIEMTIMLITIGFMIQLLKKKDPVNAAISG